MNSCFSGTKGIVPVILIVDIIDKETLGNCIETHDNKSFCCQCLKQENPSHGWWESFVGPGCALDSDKFFIICCNNLGGCYGSRFV